MRSSALPMRIWLGGWMVAALWSGGIESWKRIFPQRLLKIFLERARPFIWLTILHWILLWELKSFNIHTTVLILSGKSDRQHTFETCPVCTPVWPSSSRRPSVISMSEAFRWYPVFSQTAAIFWQIPHFVCEGRCFFRMTLKETQKRKTKVHIKKPPTHLKWSWVHVSVWRNLHQHLALERVQWKRVCDRVFVWCVCMQLHKHGVRVMRCSLHPSVLLAFTS